MPVGTAIVGASAISAGAGALASRSAAKQQANAATSAAQVQANAANRAADIQLQMFNTIRGDLTGYRNIGASALPGLSALLGLPPQAPTSAPGYSGSAGPYYVPGAGSGWSMGGPGGAPTGFPDPTAGGGGPLSYDPATGRFMAVAPGGSGAASPDWAAYLAAPNNKDILDEYNRLIGSEEGRQQLASLGIGSPEQYGAYHYATFSGDRPLPTMAPAAAPSLNGTSNIQTFLESLPGYQFTRDQGMKAVENSLTARGLGGLSGALGKGLGRFVTGLADQTYGEQFNRMLQAVNIGQNASAQTGTFGTGAAAGASNALIGGANATASGITGAAQAGAAGTIGAANALSAGVGNAANGYLTSRILGMYSGGGGGGGFAFPTGADPVALGLT